MTPNEIIMAPLELWLAPLGTAFPLIGVAPGAGWAKVGTNGSRNYGEGVTVSHRQTIEQARPEGMTVPVKVSRTSEDLMIRCTLWDVSLEQYAAALNKAAITTVAAGAGTAGTKAVGLAMGREVATYALLARGLSAYLEGTNSQYEVNRVYQSGNIEPVFAKGRPSGLALEFTALGDIAAADAAQFGRLIHQHQASL